MLKIEILKCSFKVVIITDLGQRQNLHKNDLPITLQVPFYVVFHNLEPRMQSLLMSKRIYSQFLRDFLPTLLH